MKCFACRAEIQNSSTVCPLCGADLRANPYESPKSERTRPAGHPSEGDATGGIIPYKNPKALIAYYLGIFSGFPVDWILPCRTCICAGYHGTSRSQPQSRNQRQHSCRNRHWLWCDFYAAVGRCHCDDHHQHAGRRASIDNLWLRLAHLSVRLTWNESLLTLTCVTLSTTPRCNRQARQRWNCSDHCWTTHPL